MAPRFREDQLQRYSRQILLPEVGGRGQQALLDARVLVIGAGGLGSPVILYLAAAGVGRIDVVDSDVVDLSNLQRQILHSVPRLGVPKVSSARETVAALNPDVALVTHDVRLDESNIAALVAAADVVVDGSDNFPTRYLVNDACFLARRPLVSGAILRFEGQVTVFPNNGVPDMPCYRCLFPEPPPPGAVPSCQEAGVLGAVAGVIGTIQAAEVLKLILRRGTTLAGRLLLHDALECRFREVRLGRDPACALCGDAPTIRGLCMIGEPPACSPGTEHRLG